MTYEQPAKGKDPARVYRVDVIFGLHCFTRDPGEGEVVESALLYSDDRETRVFDFVRYELSELLPQIVDGLAQRKCFHTGHGNFFSIEIVQRDGSRDEYNIFFTASRSSVKGRINLFVQSAYIRDPEHVSNRPAKRSAIGFYVILFNTLNKRPIIVPR